MNPGPESRPAGRKDGAQGREEGGRRGAGQEGKDGLPTPARVVSGQRPQTHLQEDGLDGPELKCSQFGVSREPWFGVWFAQGDGGSSPESCSPPRAHQGAPCPHPGGAGRQPGWESRHPAAQSHSPPRNAPRDLTCISDFKALVVSTSSDFQSEPVGGFCPKGYGVPVSVRSEPTAGSERVPCLRRCVQKHPSGALKTRATPR